MINKNFIFAKNININNNINKIKEILMEKKRKKSY